MIEEDAKTKWCPFARPGQVRPEDCGEVRGNRMMQGEVDTGALCVAASCAAWRWSREPAFVSQNGIAKRNGYCGLAGAPQ